MKLETESDVRVYLDTLCRVASVDGDEKPLYSLNDGRFVYFDQVVFDDGIRIAAVVESPGNSEMNMAKIYSTREVLRTACACGEVACGWDAGDSLEWLQQIERTLYGLLHKQHP